VALLHTLGIENPKVAVLSSVEKVNPKMPDSVDGDALKRMNQTGEIIGCAVEGPISFDLATSSEAARIKGFDSPVAGDADLLIVPDIVSGNILAKCLTGFAGATTAGAVLGARVPVILTSRSAEASDKYYSIALAACAAKAADKETTHD
jgi:phosphotransacetylase